MPRPVARLRLGLGNQNREGKLQPPKASMKSKAGQGPRKVQDGVLG